MPPIKILVINKTDCEKMRKRFLLLILFSFSLGSQAQLVPKYLDAEAEVQERIDDLMERMTLEDKVAQMCQYVGLEHMKKAEKNLTIEEMRQSDAQGFYPGLYSWDVARMVEEGRIGSFLHVKTAEEANYLQKLAQKSTLKIPLLIGIDAIHGNGFVTGSTIYPSPISIAASWSDSLAYEIARQSALEMRATGSHWTFTPNVDVLRDPRWGRCGETFGEDPFLVGNMGAAQVRGFQSDNFTGRDHVIACAKHFIGGGESLNGLNSAPTDISMRSVHEIHLPPYKKLVKESGVFSIMAAHNELNGIPCHSDKAMMTDLIRDDWGFEGFYVSDWMDVGRIWHLHHAAESFKEAAILSVNAGMDMHMHGPEFHLPVVEAVREGKIPMERIDQACGKILEAKFRLGLFEDPFVDVAAIDEIVYNEQHQQTALESARKSIVLLENNGLLPLNTERVKKLFLTGPNADNMTILGDWVDPQPEDRYSTVYEGIRDLALKKNYTLDFLPIEERSKEISEASISKAVEQAKSADVAILVMGENSFRHDWANKTTGENMARSRLHLSGRQNEMAQKVMATGVPVIIVLVNGSPVSTPLISGLAAAVVEAWEPGSFGGQAVAEVIFGVVNPSGKLPVTVPKHVGQLQMVYNYKPSMYKHKYHDELNEPLYPFGYGLSYTKFDYSDPVLSRDTLTLDKNVFVEVNVRNTGKMAGEEIVQLYIRDDFSSVTRPVKELKGYRRIHLEAGQSKKVRFSIQPELLAYYNQAMNYVVEKGSFTLMTGNSSSDADLKKIKLFVNETIYVDE
jgi:beta-glucosidase